MTNQYEIAVLYDPNVEVDLSKAEAKVQKIITDGGGTVTKTDNWGNKKLTYKIAKHDTAIYVFYTVELPAEAVRKVEATLNITGEVIRYLLTRPDLKAIAKAEATRAEKAKKALERGEAADEESERE